MANSYDQFVNVEYFFYKIYQFFNFLWEVIFGSFFSGSGAKSGLTDKLFSYLDTTKLFLELLTLIFITLIIYCLVRIYEIRKEEYAKLSKEPVTIDEAPYHNEQWDVVLAHLHSESEGDWRLAIIEADNMLDAMVKKMGYEGEDLGERLKSVEQSDFQSLQSAWEAHKVRNIIVHEGVGFKVTKADAERVIRLYEHVFREFRYI